MANKTQYALQQITKVSDLMPSPNVLSFFDRLAEAYKEDTITSREIAKIDAHKEILIMAITEKYSLYHKIFDRIFEERQIAVNKAFEIIDKGIKEDDRELISVGLRTLSQIVSSSPFANIAELSKMLETGQTIEI